MATWGGVSVLGAILGFVLSGILTTWISWRWMFAVPVVVALLGLASARRLLSAGEADSSRRPGLDPLGAVLATAGIVSISIGLIASGELPWTSAGVWGPVSAGIALLAAFFYVEHQAGDPLLPPGFLRDPCRVAGMVGMLLAAAASALIEYVLSLYLQQARGWTPLATALAFLPFAVTLIGANQLAPSLVGRVGAAHTTSAGSLIAAAGLGLLAWIDRDTTYLAGLLPGMMLLAAGMSLMFSGAAVLSTTHVPPHQSGLAGGVMNTAMELGPTVGLAVLMSIAATQADTVAGYRWAFGSAGVLFALAAFGVGAMTGRRAADGSRVCQSSAPAG